MISKKDKLKIYASEILEEDNAIEVNIIIKVKREQNTLSDDKYNTYLEITKEYY